MIHYGWRWTLIEDQIKLQPAENSVSQNVAKVVGATSSKGILGIKFVYKSPSE